MQGLDYHDKRAVPAWCQITELGSLVSPYDGDLFIPRDAYRSLDIFWDGTWCRARYYPWDYGLSFRYEGSTLPLNRGQWTREHYIPSAELEVRIINLAGTGMVFEDLEKMIRRPRMEICAILYFHGYNGHACALHRGLTISPSSALTCAEFRGG